jgi:hypothetical protein
VQSLNCWYEGTRGIVAVYSSSHILVVHILQLSCESHGSLSCSSVRTASVVVGLDFVYKSSLEATIQYIL